MENRYFITEVYVPSGCRTMETNLAAVPRRYVDHILSYDAMLRLADEVAQTQAQLLNENRRLKPVDISIDLDGQTDRSRLACYRHFYIGQVSVHFRHVKGEII